MNEEVWSQGPPKPHATRERRSDGRPPEVPRDIRRMVERLGGLEFSDEWEAFGKLLESRIQEEQKALGVKVAAFLSDQVMGSDAIMELRRLACAQKARIDTMREDADLLKRIREKSGVEADESDVRTDESG